MTQPIRVLLADDDPQILASLTSLLTKHDVINLIASVNDGAQALEVIAEQPIDIALLDVDMPVLDGVATATEIAIRHPQVKVIMLTAFEHNDSFQRSLAVGARGFLTKDVPIGRMVKIIGRVQAGEVVLDQRPTSLLIESYLQHDLPVDPEFRVLIENLSPKLKEIVDFLISGSSNKEIAKISGLAERTVRAYVSELIAVTGCESRTQVVARALAAGYRRQLRADEIE